MESSDWKAFVSKHLDNLKNNWSIGVYGAVADFSVEDHVADVVRKSTENCEELITPKGSIRIHTTNQLKVTPIAWEHAWGVDSKTWIQSVALCLPANSNFGGSSVLTEIGPDTDAIHECDRSDILFDMGVGFDHTRFCIRTRNPILIKKLREKVGISWNAKMDDSWLNVIVEASTPHRVVMTPLGRVEVYQPIPSSHGSTPNGPHTHFLPVLLNTKLASSQMIPIPNGLVQCLSLEPQNPIMDHQGNLVEWNQEAHETFQQLLKQFGDEKYLDCKRRAREAIYQGGCTQLVDDSIFIRAYSVTLRQEQNEDLKKKNAHLFEVQVIPQSTLYTIDEIEKHNNAQDCWIIIDLKVYNVTRFMYAHPAGADLILAHAGKDATGAFASVSHSASAKMLLKNFKIGEIHCDDVKKLNNF